MEDERARGICPGRQDRLFSLDATRSLLCLLSEKLAWLEVLSGSWSRAGIHVLNGGYQLG